MDELTRTSRARHLLVMLSGSVAETFPELDDWVTEVICVQFVATLIELDRKSKGL